jgi:prepilin-type N-terminal cleavage/methylation domain-containing protein
MSRKGVTLLELLVVVVIVGVLVMIGFPTIKTTLQKTQIRSARVAAGTYVATARSAAIQRGCRGVVHFTAASGGVWVTVCPRLTVAGSGTVDTLGRVAMLATQYSVTMSETLDSVQFDPRGLSLTNAQSTVKFTGSSGLNDSILINSLGKVVR